MENNEDKGLEDKEVTHQEDKEGDLNKITHSSKVIRITRSSKVIKVIRRSSKDILKEGINSEEIFEVSRVLEVTKTDLETTGHLL
jgi:hypothetical protein